MIIAQVSEQVRRDHDTHRVVQAELAGARASALLMTCNVNGRNLDGHGFPLVARIARTVPAIRLVYSSFHGLGELLDQLLATLPRP